MVDGDLLLLIANVDNGSVSLWPNPMAPGSSFETCLTFLIPGGITKVAYTGTESYIEKPVTWSP